MFSFFKKKPRPAASLESIGCDMHSHLIPGIDDGAPDMETSMLLIRGLVDLGYRKLITTPHINTDHFRNTPEIILSGRDRVIGEIRRQGLTLEFGAAAEYLIDEGFTDQLARSATFVAATDNPPGQQPSGQDTPSSSPASPASRLPEGDSAPDTTFPSSPTSRPPEGDSPPGRQSNSQASRHWTSPGPFLPLKDNLILVELSFVVPSLNLKQIIFDLQLKGYQPVLAHPERYVYFAGNKGWYDQLREIGCLFQLNLLSFSGHYGPEVRSLAQYLVKKKYVDFLGTDMHHPGHLELLRHSTSVQKAVRQIVDLGLLRNPSL